MRIRAVASWPTGVRSTGIRDLFVHCGPLADDGTLNPARRPKARWLVTGDGHMDLERAATRTAVTRSVRIALYVDFTATAQDWASYLTDWMGK